MDNNSSVVAKASIKMAISSREEESELRDLFKDDDVLVCAADIGGNLINCIPKIIERAIVSAKKTNIIRDTHVHEGAVAGAAREAIMQLQVKASGLSVGGKIGIARRGEHLSVCIYISIGLLHLNDLAIGIGHRSIPN